MENSNPLDHFRQSARVALDQNWRYWQSNEDGGLDDYATLAALTAAAVELVEQVIGPDMEYHKLSVCSVCGRRQYSCSCESAVNQRLATQRAALTKENQHGE